MKLNCFVFYFLFSFFNFIFADDPKPITFSRENQFTIDGYHFFNDDSDFRIKEEDLFFIQEEGKEILPGNSYRKIIKLINTQNDQEKSIKTRVINTTHRAKIAKVIQKKSSLFSEEWDMDGFTYPKTFWTFAVAYELILEDGESLHLKHEWVSSDLASLDLDFKILPEDTVNILSEKLAEGNFRHASFVIKIYRGEKEVGEFGREGSRLGPYSVTGIARQEYHKEKQETVYTIKTTRKDDKQLFIDNLISFYEIEGLWKIPHANTYHYPPYKGMQYEIIDVSFNKILVRTIDGKEMFTLSR